MAPAEKEEKKVKTVQSVLYIISCTLVNRTTLLGQKIENTEKMMKPHENLMKPHGNRMEPQDNIIGSKDRQH